MSKLRHSLFVSAPYFYSMIVCGFLLLGFQNCGQGFKPIDLESVTQPEIEPLANCGATPHGGHEIRTYYQQASVSFGSTCASEVQSRTCTDGEFSPWSGTYTFVACFAEPAQSCGLTAHGSQEVRTRYQQDSVPFGTSCTSETQSRTCNNGQFGSWSGTYTFPSCAVQSALSCGATAHGGQEMRTRYQQDSVPFGSTCTSEVQTRTCNNGQFGSWSGTYTFSACTVQGAQSCGSIPHNGTESRLMYQQSTVPYGSTCVSQTQTRSCSNGTFGNWSGTYTFTSCSVSPPASCGSTPHGGNESRTMYREGTVPYGSTCVSQTQTHTCNNGQFGPWTGTYTFASCSVAQAASCGSTPHGGTETRTAYKESSVHYDGGVCTSQSQTRTCSNGTFSAWSGTYQFTACASRDFNSLIDVKMFVSLGGYVDPYFIGSDNKLYGVNLSLGRAILDPVFSSYQVQDAAVNVSERCIVTSDGRVFCNPNTGSSAVEFPLPVPARSVRVQFQGTRRAFYLTNNELRMATSFPETQQVIGTFSGVTDYYINGVYLYILNSQNQLQALDFPDYRPVTGITNVAVSTMNTQSGWGFNIVYLAGNAVDASLSNGVFRITDLGYGANNVKVVGRIFTADGSDYRCALKTDKSVYCAKNANHTGVAGTQGGLEVGVTDLSGAHTSKCALLTNGKLKCWGGSQNKAPIYIEKPLN